MDHLEYLVVYRSQLKRWVSEDLERALDRLHSRVRPASEFANELLQLEGRLNAVENEMIQGVIETEDRHLFLNRIRADLLRWIDRLSYDDIQEEEDEVFRGFQAEYQQARTGSQPLSPQSSAEPAALADLEIFAEMHREILAFYPLLYREVRSIIIRNDAKDERTGPMLVLLSRELAALQSLKEQMELLERKVPKIPREAAEKVLNLQYKKLKYRFSRLGPEKLAEELPAIREELRALG